MNSPAAKTFRFPLLSKRKLQGRNDAKNERQYDVWRWRYLRYRDEYRIDYVELLRETATDRLIFEDSQRSVQDRDQSQANLIAAALWFSQQWRISEPIDHEEPELPDGVFFLPIGIISQNIITSANQDEAPGTSTVDGSAERLRSQIQKMTAAGATPRILQLNIDLDAVKGTTQLKIGKIITEARSRLGVTQIKGFERLGLDRIEDYLKIYSLHRKGNNPTEIARMIYKHGTPSNHVGEVQEKIQKAERLISLAPFLPF